MNHDIPRPNYVPFTGDLTDYVALRSHVWDFWTSYPRFGNHAWDSPTFRTIDDWARTNPQQLPDPELMFLCLAGTDYLMGEEDFWVSPLPDGSAPQLHAEWDEFKSNLAQTE